MSGKAVGAFVLIVAFLGLSASNYLLFTWWQEEEKSATQAGEQLADATRDAKQCSAGVAELETQAAAAAASAASAIAESRKRADTLQARAQRQLRSQPSTPGNDCKSAADRFDAWLIERNQ